MVKVFVVSRFLQEIIYVVSPFKSYCGGSFCCFFLRTHIDIPTLPTQKHSLTQRRRNYITLTFVWLVESLEVVACRQQLECAHRGALGELDTLRYTASMMSTRALEITASSSNASTSDTAFPATTGLFLLAVPSTPTWTSPVVTTMYVLSAKCAPSLKTPHPPRQIHILIFHTQPPETPAAFHDNHTASQHQNGDRKGVRGPLRYHSTPKNTVISRPPLGRRAWRATPLFTRLQRARRQQRGGTCI